jgi:pilus assembly protein CpaE
MDEFSNEDKEKIEQEIIVFASAKGGVGKTVLSVNMAVALAQRGFSTCILDGNFQFGDVNLALDLQPKLTISDLVQDLKHMHTDMLSNYLQTHESGLKVLSAPIKPEYADLITPDDFKNISEMLSIQEKYLIVDLPSGITENNISVMEIAHKIIIITDLEMAALKNTKTMLKTLEDLKLSEKIYVIVNRADMESVIGFRDVARIIETDNIYSISNNFKVVSKSFNIGIPFVINKPNEKISSEINNIISKIFIRKTQGRVRRKKRKSFLGLFGK